MTKFAVIGAGISGLTIARFLSENHEVDIFEKSRSVGGRLATRYAGDFEFDHGAQFFNAKSQSFKKLVHTLAEQGAVKIWNGEFIEFDAKTGKIDSSRIWDDEFPHYVGSPRMNVIGKNLAENLNVKLLTKINNIKKQNEQWQLYDIDQNHLGSYDFIISAIPSQQASEILPKEFVHSNKISQIQMLPCFSLMIGMKNLNLPFTKALVKNSKVSWISVNSSKPNRNQAQTLMICSSNSWAKDNIEIDLSEAKAILLKEASDVLNIDLSQNEHADIHRWLYANYDGKGAVEKSYVDFENSIAACGDWCIKGRVEAAFESAENLFEKIINKI